MSLLLEEVESQSRETAQANRERVRILTHDELAEKIEWLRNSLLDAPAQAITLYKLADIAARSADNPQIGVHVWRKTRAQFASLLKDWENVEKMGDPLIDRVVEHYCEGLRELLAAAQHEYRSYKETAYVLLSPNNAKRLEEALEAARSGKLPVFENAEEALKSLRTK